MDLNRQESKQLKSISIVSKQVTTHNHIELIALLGLVEKGYAVERDSGDCMYRRFSVTPEGKYVARRLPIFYSSNS